LCALGGCGQFDRRAFERGRVRRHGLNDIADGVLELAGKLLHAVPAFAGRTLVDGAPFLLFRLGLFDRNYLEVFDGLGDVADLVLFD
jgi:hypothetical protein